MIKCTLHKLPEEYIITSNYNEIAFDINGKSLDIKGKLYPIIAQQDQIDFSALSKEEQENIGWFDVEKIVENIMKNWIHPARENEDKTLWYSIKESNKQSFQKAQELLSDRMFTLDDITQILVDYTNQLQNMKFKGTAADTINQFIAQSLSQPKSWNIEGVWENDKFKITKIL